MELSPKGKQLVEYTLTARAWTLEKLAGKSEIGISTVKKFYSGKSVHRTTFVNLCKILEVDWEIASGQTILAESPIDRPSKVSEESIAPSESPIDRPATPSQSNEAWIEQAREHCRQRILSQHSRMRLLSGKEIGVDQLYVDVYLLDRPEHTLYKSPESILKTFDIENDRLALARRVGDRNPGFDVANDNSKLIILGKPGAGKTTFLKHLAVDWCNGKFQLDSIAILLELRRIQDEQWNLVEAICKELGSENQHLVVDLLQQGKLLVLMDGLDEAPTHKLRHNVQEQLEQIARDYPKNRLVLTCRTQIMGGIPIGFTPVEVADFSELQVQRFVENWFIANGKPSSEALQQWEKFNYAIGNNLALKELTTTPVLLSLICLVSQDSGEIPEQRDWLYQKGVKLLLSKWNDTKQIDSWEIGTGIYQQLNIEQKEALLTEIAARKFEDPTNFVLFQQDEIAAQISQFLQLADRREGVAVLKAIEAHHGLLIERADELWSFSHLTFQEYFTVQWLTKLPSEQLAQKIADKQWQRTVEQIVESQQPADRLVQLIKQAIDRSIANEPKLQAFLAWVLQKSASTRAKHKPAGIRAFYFGCALDLALCRDRALDLTYNLARALDLNLARDIDLARALDLALARALALAFDLTPALAHALVRDLDLACNLDPKLTDKLSKLMLILRTASIEDFQQWWSTQGSQWINQLQQVMIEDRNIGHNWQFTETQVQQLQRYYDLNKFLVELINIKGATTDTARTEIEDTLLLPWEELQRRQR